MKIKYFLSYILLLFVNFIVAVEVSDALLTTKQFVTKYGYPFEIYDLVTEDGYNTKIYRIPHGKRSTKNNKKSVLIMHGLLSNAEHFIISGNTSLSFNLADNGFDVWLANTRANYPTRKHRVYKISQPEFWDYSWDDFALNELPVTIDFILNKTNKNNLLFVGHSQGAALPMVLNHYRPEYDKKIKAAALLAPPVSLKHTKSLLLNIAANGEFFTQIQHLFGLLGIYSVPPIGTDQFTVAIDLCSNGSPLINLCDSAMRHIAELDSDQIEKKLIPIIAKNTEPASFKQLKHFGQFVKTGRFQHYDYQEDNQKIYGSAEPPEYNLNKTTFPIALFYGKSDAIINYRDVEELGPRLRNHVFTYLVPYPKWNHLDFCFAINGYEQYQRSRDRKSVV